LDFKEKTAPFAGIVTIYTLFLEIDNFRLKK